jgi:hypothetical protein
MGNVLVFPSTPTTKQPKQINKLTMNVVREHALNLLPEFEARCDGQLDFTYLYSSIEKTGEGFFIEARVRIFIPNVSVGVRYDIQGR